MSRNMTRPIIGVLVAIAITTTMDATGLSMFSALPLLPLLALFWYLQRLPRREVGFVWGRGRPYGLAVLYPVLVMGLIALVAVSTGAIDLSNTDWGKAGLNLALMSVSTFLMTIITEEGFFRGWLWASLGRTGMASGRILVGTSVAFAAWHVSAATLAPEFAVPVAQLPVYLANVVVLGIVWGLLRWMSGSVLVASLSHGVWNGLAYVLFGYGTKHGALGIENTAVYGPEVGVLGLGVNLAACGALLWWWKARAGDGES